MKFQEAEKKLKRIAGGEYCTLQFTKTIPSSTGTPETECWVYVNKGKKGKTGKGQTWVEAFMGLEKDLGITKVEETPDVDDGEPPKTNEVDLAKQVCGMEVK